MLRRFVVASAIGALVVGWSNVVVAQQQQGAQGTAIKIDGTVKQVVAQGILVTGKDGKTYGLGFTPTSKVGLNGTAGVEFIKPNMMVQFEVTMDEKEKPVGELKKIQIVTPSDINVPSFSHDKGPDAKEGEAGLYFVRGTVNTNKDGTLTVTTVTGKGKSIRLTVKVAAGVTVPVTIGDWKLAKEGDVITGDATSFGPQQGLAFIPAQGDLIEIKAAAPIDFKKGKK